MGQAKQLLPFRGRTLLRHSVEVAVASVCRPVVVVLGAEHDRCAAELEGLPVHTVYNPAWSDGMASSIHAGLDALLMKEPAVNAVVLCLCDQPHLTSTVLDTLVSTYKEAGRSAIGSAYGDTVGAPALFARSLFEDLRALKGDQGARRLLARDGKGITNVQFPGGVEDVDIPEDYAKISSLL